MKADYFLAEKVSGGHRSRPRRPFSPAEWSGFIALFLYMPLWMIDSRLAVIPLGLFVLACGIFPFLPGVSFFFPVISRGRSAELAVSLTFDDGPDPVSTPALLRILEDHGVLATFFVTGERSRRHPDIIRGILSRGHSIGNHSYTHDDFIMFRKTKTLIQEIEATQQVLQELGAIPQVFRPCVGITTSRYADALHQTGLAAVNFSRRARDMGNRRVQGLSRRILNKLRADDIILLHDTPPRKTADFQPWLTEIDRIIEGTTEKGLTIVPLQILINRPVTISVAPSGHFTQASPTSRSS